MRYDNQGIGGFLAAKRMGLFYDGYCNDIKLSPLVREFDLSQKLQPIAAEIYSLWIYLSKGEKSLQYRNQLIWHLRGQFPAPPQIAKLLEGVE